jgi:uncharacterized protein (UPF0332 family)
MTPEQKALLQKAQDSLRGARLLAGDGLYDFAVSRAYYTMFYVAEALLLGQGLSFSTPSAVVAAFGRRFANTGIVPVEFHRYLIDGQDMRTIGDYSTGCRLTEAEASEQVARAVRFLELAERLIGPLPPPASEDTSTSP